MCCTAGSTAKGNNTGKTSTPQCTSIAGHMVSIRRYLGCLKGYLVGAGHVKSSPAGPGDPHTRNPAVDFSRMGLWLPSEIRKGCGPPWPEEMLAHEVQPSICSNVAYICTRQQQGCPSQLLRFGLFHRTVWAPAKGFQNPSSKGGNYICHVEGLNDFAFMFKQRT